MILKILIIAFLVSLFGYWILKRIERRLREKAQFQRELEEIITSPAPVQTDDIKVSVAELLPIVNSKYMLKLPGYIHEAFNDCFLNNKPYALMPSSFHDDVEKAKKEQEEENIRQQAWEADYQKISEHRLAGMEKEKSADNEGAISEYAVAIILGEQSKFKLFHAYSHAYERIIVCLRKAKRFDKEVSYIERYLKYDLSEAARSKYSTRLEKLKTKIS